MKKPFLVLLALFLSATCIFCASGETYAAEVPVMFKITNHEAEGAANLESGSNKIKVEDKFPNIKVRYKNAIRVSLMVEDSAGALINSELMNVNLKNEMDELTFDMSDLEVEPGEYVIKVAAYNADDAKRDADDIDLAITQEAPEAPEVPEVPNTGSINIFGNELSKSGIAFSLGVVIILAGVSMAIHAKKGVRK